MSCLLQDQWYDETIDLSFAAQSQRLLAKLKGATMKTFKLTVIQVTRLEVKVLADSEVKAKDNWIQGQLINSEPIGTEIIDVQRLAA